MSEHTHTHTHRIHIHIHIHSPPPPYAHLMLALMTKMFSITGEGIEKYVEVAFCGINVVTWSRVEWDTEWETCVYYCVSLKKKKKN